MRNDVVSFTVQFGQVATNKAHVEVAVCKGVKP